jgi:hypothetical protein
VVARFVMVGSLVGTTACRSRAHEVGLPRAEGGSDWVIWDLDPAVGRERCEIHGELLVTAVVPIKGGYAPPETLDRGFLGAEGEQFPHAAESEEDGCFPLPFTHARVKRCSKCVEAKQRWLSLHPNVDPSGRPRLTGR